MYYKIENKTCQVYQDLHTLRTKEMQIRKENEAALKKKIGLKYEMILGDIGQQNFHRVPEYIGFNFTEPEKVDLKIWKTHAEHPETYIPNKKTKAGREMSKFLSNGLKRSFFRTPLDILKLPDLRKFTFPYVEIAKNGVIVLYLGDGHEPKDKNLIEITKKEFTTLLK